MQTLCHYWPVNFYVPHRESNFVKRGYLTPDIVIISRTESKDSFFY